MKWRRHDSFAIVSYDGRYAIPRIGGSDGCFEVWRTRKHDEGPHLVAHNVATADEARALAEADAADCS